MLHNSWSWAENDLNIGIRKVYCILATMKPRGRSTTQGRRTVGHAVLSEINFFKHLHKTMPLSQGLLGSNVDISCVIGLTTQVLQFQPSMSFMVVT